MPDLVRSIVRPLLLKLMDKTIHVMAEDCKFQKEAELYGDENIEQPGWLKWKQEIQEEKERRKNHGSDLAAGKKTASVMEWGQVSKRQAWLISA